MATVFYDFKVNMNFTIDDNVTIRAEFYEILLNFTSYDKETSFVGPIEDGTIEWYVWSFVIEQIRTELNSLFGQGVALNDVIHEILGLDFIDFHEMKLRNYDGYALFQITPLFKFETAL